MQQEVSRERLLSGLEWIKGAEVSVFGDVMLDHYQYGTVDRISPEAPVPVVRVDREEYRLGGAANVARNVRSLGGETTLLGCCGNNSSRDRIGELLQQERIRDGILTVPAMATIQKTRVIAQSQQVLRIDKEDAEARPETEQIRESLLGEEYGPPETLILSDYGKGTLSPAVLSMLTTSEFASCRLIIDPKPENFTRYPSPELITPNRKEAENIWGGRITGQEEILSAGDVIRERSCAANVLITLGEEGMVLFQDTGEVYRISTLARHVFDVTGAGDTVAAVAAVSMSAGLDPLHSCLLANISAGLVVEEIGAATVTPQELEHQIHSRNTFSVHKWR